MNKKIKAVSVLIIILFVSTIAGTIFYYNGVVSDRNSEIASLNNQIVNQNNEIANLTSQISNINSEVTNLTSAHLVASLGVAEISGNATTNNPPQQTYNHLFIKGSVTNTGVDEAYNAGLHVVAYSATGTLEIDMTVPLEYIGAYGTDSATTIYVAGAIGPISLQLGNLDSKGTTTVEIAIYHEGIVSNWTITPVWTNTP